MISLSHNFKDRAYSLSEGVFVAATLSAVAVGVVAVGASFSEAVAGGSVIAAAGGVVSAAAKTLGAAVVLTSFACTAKSAFSAYDTFRPFTATGSALLTASGLFLLVTDHPTNLPTQAGTVTQSYKTDASVPDLRENRKVAAISVPNVPKVELRLN